MIYIGSDIVPNLEFLEREEALQNVQSRQVELVVPIRFPC